VDSIFGDFKVVNVWGTSTATVKPSLAGLDTGVRLMNVKLFGYAREAARVEYSKEVSFTKEACRSYVFAALMVPVETRFCVGGKAGVELRTDLTPTSLASSVRPFAFIGSEAQATVNAGGFRASIEGEAEILGINRDDKDRAEGRLTLSVTGQDPPTLQIGVDVAASMKVATLSADLRLVLETLEPDICSKKILGHRFKYPCVDWDEVASVRLARFDGYGYRQVLLDRSASMTLK
jgi:hypothetical protein